MLMKNSFLKVLTLLLIQIWIFTLDVRAQIKDSIMDNEIMVTCVDDYFIFSNGVDSLMSFIKSKTNYPVSSFGKGIHGRVVVEITIDSLGYVIDSKIIKGVNDELNNEALRVCRLLPQWIPNDSKAKMKVKFQKFAIPFKFELNNKK
jgi:TonB family protein